MRARHVGGTDDRAEVVGILDPVQQEEERLLPLLLSRREEVVDLRVGVLRRARDHALVASRLRHLVEPLSGDVFDRRSRLRRLPLDRHDRPVFTSVQNIQPVDGPSRAEGLDHGISSFNIRHTCYLDAVPEASAPVS